MLTLYAVRNKNNPKIFLSAGFVPLREDNLKMTPTVQFFFKEEDAKTLLKEKAQVVTDWEIVSDCVDLQPTSAPRDGNDPRYRV